jgi:hypothetical protein
MKGAECRRLWEVEALRDGRLSGDLAKRSVEHRERCDTCATHAHRLERLAETLRESAPKALDRVALLRLRHRVLEDADSALAKSSPRIVPAKWLGYGLGLALVAAGALVVARRAQPDSDAALAESARTHARTGVVLRTVGEPTWSESHAPGVRRFVLSSGTLELAIVHSPGDERVIVQVPDGTIEDQGTKFSVSVASGHTSSLRVTEGAIVFQRTEGTAVRVSAGQVWVPAPAVVNETDAPLVTRSEPPVQAAPAPRALAALEPAAEITAEPTRTTSPRPRTLRSEAFPMVRTAPSPVRAPSGALDESATLAEDLAYLRIVALRQEGREGEATLAAKDYIRRFPAGFRRVEAERIAVPR